MAGMLNQTTNEFVDPVSNEDLAAATNTSGTPSANSEPEGGMSSGNAQVDNLVAWIRKNFPDVDFAGNGMTAEERIAAWANELNNPGSGRDYAKLRSDILTHVVGRDRIKAWARAQFESRNLTIAAGDESEEERLDRITGELLSGEKTFEGLGQTLDQYGSVLPDPPKGTERVGDQIVPEGMYLLRVGDFYYGVGTVNGVEFAYEIGTEQDVIDTFGSVTAFAVTDTMDQEQFNASEIMNVGSIDEVLGAGESLQAIYERDAREFNMESPPDWVKNDPAAMAIFVTGTNEDWSAEKIWNSLSHLDSFKERFKGLELIQDQLGVPDYATAIQEYLAREDGVRASLLKYRGPNADVSQETVASIVASGWQAAEVAELLELERDIRDSPEALAEINAILAYNGMDPLSADDFVDYLRDSKHTGEEGYEPSDIFEAVNDALRKTALAAAGIDISMELAEELGREPSYSIHSPDAFRDQAQYIAGVVSANRTALDLGLYDLDQDEVLRFFLGETDDPEIGRKLERLGRERGIAAQGFEGQSAYIDNRGRLRAQGLADAQ